MVQLLAKGRYNFTLSCRARKRLKEVSDNSIILLGRHCSMSEVLEILIDKSFIDRKSLLGKQMSETKQKLVEMEIEWNAIIQKEKNTNISNIAMEQINI